MRTNRFLLGLGLLGTALVASGDVRACGDKLVVVGRGLRAGRMRSGPLASILIFADPKGSLPAALAEGHLRKDLERAGHRLRSVTTEEELKAALGSGSYDLVLADFKSAPGLESEAKAAASRPTVLPTLFNPSQAELAAASQEYSCVVKSPSDQKDYMSVINEAMAERAKQGSPKAK